MASNNFCWLPPPCFQILRVTLSAVECAKGLVFSNRYFHFTFFGTDVIRDSEWHWSLHAVCLHASTWQPLIPVFLSFSVLFFSSLPFLSSHLPLLSPSSPLPSPPLPPPPPSPPPFLPYPPPPSPFTPGLHLYRSCTTEHMRWFTKGGLRRQGES